jgi:uncharacterized membrane protein
MSWLIFAIIPYALYSITVFTDKFLIEKRIKHPITVIVLGGGFSLLLGLLLFAWRGFVLLPPLQSLLLLGSGICLTLYLIPYFKALALDDASRIGPFFQFYPVFVLILASIFLHERLTALQAFGFFFVIIGGFILGAEKLTKRFFTLRPSFWYMVLSSFIYSLTGLLFKYVTVSDFWLNASYEAMGIGIGALLLLFFPVYKRQLRSEVRRLKFDIVTILLFSELVALLADFSTFYAITLAPVSLVSAMQGTQPVFLLAYGLTLTRWFPHIIKEDVTRKILLLKLGAIVVLGVGVVLCSL